VDFNFLWAHSLLYLIVWIEADPSPDQEVSLSLFGGGFVVVCKGLKNYFVG